MAAIAKENLDERIERIKKRNEEIEKKHREAEEDRLMALKINAMVKTKPPKDDDWPKAHKFDNLDFTYDVNPEKLEEHKQLHREEEHKPRRDYKKFAEGEGPPPDPAYNFLADAERDGKPEKYDKKDSRQMNSNNHNKQKDQLPYKRSGAGGTQSNSFRGRNSDKSTHNNGRFQKQNSHPEYDQWRSERNRIDDARINRQKNGDKWKREWDSEKHNESSNNTSSKLEQRITSSDTFSAGTKKSPTHHVAKTNQQQHNHNNHHFNYNQETNLNLNDSLVDKRANITVSVSQVGEVKSVKLTSAPVIGTGRVGPRQISKPHFQIQTIAKEISAPIQQVPALPLSVPRPYNKGQQKSNQIQRQNHNQNRQQQQLSPTALNHSNVIVPPKSPIKLKNNLQSAGIFQQQPSLPPQNLVATSVAAPNLLTISQVAATTAPDSVSNVNGVVPIDLSHKPEFAKRSVQDRLLRIRQVNSSDTDLVTNNNNNTNKNVELKDFIDEKIESSKNTNITNCDKAKDSIQSVESIVACN